MTPTLRLALLSALLFVAAPAARADWSGTLRVRVEPKQPNGTEDQDGVIAGKDGKMRIDTEHPGMGKMGMVIDLRGHKSMLIIDARHAFMTMDLDKMQGRGQVLGSVHCEAGEEAAACLKKIGFTKSGVETVNGKKSDRWEHDREDEKGQKLHETMWVPQGVKGFAMVKQVTKGPERTITLDVLDFKEGAQPEEKFEPPAGYTDMTGKAGMKGPPGAHGHP